MGEHEIRDYFSKNVSTTDFNDKIFEIFGDQGKLFLTCHCKLVC